MAIRSCWRAAFIFALLLGSASHVNSASFEVVEENGGLLCWVRVQVSENLNLSLFTDKGEKLEEITLLLEDEEIDPETYARLGETFDIAIQLEGGDRLRFSGFFDEALSAPVADLTLSQLRKLVGQSNWDISIADTSSVTVNDVITDALYRKFVACAGR